MTKQNLQELEMSPQSKTTTISINHSRSRSSIQLQISENNNVTITTTDRITVTCQPRENLSEESNDDIIPQLLSNPNPQQVEYPSPETYSISSCKCPQKAEIYEALRRRLAQTCGHLWYHLNVDMNAARSLLKNSKSGTFLLRDSQNPDFIFSLSVVATNIGGVMNIRIGYHEGLGLFYLDCDERTRHKMPHFTNIVELIYYYSGRRLSGRGRRHLSFDDQGRRFESKTKCIWTDANKRKYVPVQLTQPKLQALPSLKHMCRLRINSSIELKCDQLEDRGLSVSADAYREQLKLPNILKEYLQSYPYAI